MYVKVYTRHNGNWDATFVEEMTAKELKQAKRKYPNRLHLVISGAEAHQWVRKGGVHGTPLYVDHGRVRYARDAR